MNPRLLQLYNQELAFLRDMGAEFAQQFPKIAGRLGMEGLEVTDPYIERLLEGSAFLTSRLQYKLDAEFERFTHRLLEIVYPNFLAPVPAMVVARFDPDLSDANLARGVPLPRGTALRAQPAGGDATACEFTTAQDVALYPLRIVEARYFSFAPDLPLQHSAAATDAKGGVRIKLQVGAGLTAQQLQLDTLRVTLAGAEETSYRLLELLSTAFKAAYVVARDRPASLIELAPGAVRASGYGDDEALLPVSAAVFQGYRLLQEYFAFPARFLSFEVQHLRAALAQVDASEFELVLLFGKGDAQLESLVDAAMFALFATPAVNLRPRRADRINVDAAHDEFHVVVDRTRPMDFEVHSLLELTGLSSSEGQTAFLPLYSAFHLESGDHAAYYTVRREQRLLSQTQRRQGPRSSYVGSEMFVSLVDPKQAPFSAELQQLAPRVLVTNRDLPLLMPVGQGASDFSLEVAAPVKSIRCIRGPSRPFAPLAEGALSWKLISHLSLNYLSLQDTDARQGAAALREMLRLYVAAAGPGATRQIDGVQSVVARPGVRRVPMSGPIAFARGTQIELTVDELAFQGGSAFLLGAVLEHFFARHAAANSYTELLLRSAQRGDLMQWAPRCGSLPIV